MQNTSQVSSAWIVSPESYLARRPPEFDLPAVPESVYITMRDGCRLASDIYLPQSRESGRSCGKVPTLLIFTPYYRRFRCRDSSVEAATAAAKYRDFFVPRGYALMVVDVRGTGASFGTRDSFRSPTERHDYGEVAQWVTEQSWSDGVVGATGVSYPGAAACFLASTGHPAVKAIAPLFGISDIYSEQIFPGGMTSKIWTVDYQDVISSLDQDDRERVRQYAATASPAYEGPQPVDADEDGNLLAQAIHEHRNNFDLNDMAAELMFRDEGTLHDPDLTFAACSPFHYIDQIAKDVAIYSVSGWFDGGGYANASISRFLSAKSPLRYLLLGPWDHGAQTDISPWRKTNVPDFALFAELLRFFDHHLMHLHTGLDKEQPVHYFSVHAEQWHGAVSWPPAADAIKLYPGNRFALDTTAEVSASEDAYQVDFSLNTGKKTRWERLGGIVVDEYYPDWDGRDAAMLSYTSDVFLEPVELTGHITAHLKLRCSQPDASIFVFASEVDKDGVSHYMTEGMLRALHRKLAEAPPNYKTTWAFRTYARKDVQLLDVNSVESLVIPMLPVSWTLQTGSRLRISICGADKHHFPRLPHGRPPLLKLVRGGTDSTFFEIPYRSVAVAK